MAWMQRYVLLMGAPPEEEEEPTEAQLAGLHKRVAILKQAPYVDFGSGFRLGGERCNPRSFRLTCPREMARTSCESSRTGAAELSAMDGFVEGL